MEAERIDQIIDEHQGAPDLLIQILLAIQSEYNWLPKAALQRIAEKLQVPLSRILHIATFYKAFSLVPKGRHKVHICLGTACHVRGAPRIETTILDNLNVEIDEMTADERFSVELVRCVGCCGLAPVVVIDENFHGKLETKDVPKILKEYT